MKYSTEILDTIIYLIDIDIRNKDMFDTIEKGIQYWNYVFSTRIVIFRKAEHDQEEPVNFISFSMVPGNEHDHGEIGYMQISDDRFPRWEDYFGNFEGDIELEFEEKEYVESYVKRLKDIVDI